MSKKDFVRRDVGAVLGLLLLLIGIAYVTFPKPEPVEAKFVYGECLVVKEGFHFACYGRAIRQTRNERGEPDYQIEFQDRCAPLQTGWFLQSELMSNPNACKHF